MIFTKQKKKKEHISISERILTFTKYKKGRKQIQTSDPEICFDGNLQICPPPPPPIK